MKKTTRRITTFFTAAALTLSMTLTAAADRALTSVAYDYAVEPRSASNIKWLHEHYPHGSRFTDSFDNARECMGFAYYCYYMYNDDHVNETIKDSNDYGIYYSLASDSALENFLRTAGTQSYVRGRTKSRSVHSIFIVDYSTSKKTVTVYDCNMDNNCGVEFATYSYSEFRQHMNWVLFCYTSDGVFLDYTDF